MENTLGNLNPTLMMAIVLIGLGSFVSRRIIQMAHGNTHRFLLMTKLSKEEVTIYIGTVFFAEILYIIELIPTYGFWISATLVIILRFIENRMYESVEESYPLKYMYRVSQLTVLVGILLLLFGM